jgi:hypothetical protein
MPGHTHNRWFVLNVRNMTTIYGKQKRKGRAAHYTVYFHRRERTGIFLYHYSFGCGCCHGGDIHVEDYAYAAASESDVKGKGFVGKIGYGGELVDASSTSGAVEASDNVVEGGDDSARASCEH